MRIFKTKEFNKIVTKDIEIADEDLKKAVEEMNKGLFDANLGGNVYKKRVALDGHGKSSGARTILCYKSGDKVFFMYAFAKNSQDNISDKYKVELKELAEYYLKLSNEKINKYIKDGTLLEIK